MKRLHRPRRGQALVFGALTLFLLVSFAAAAFDVGQVSATRIQAQNAADQAALAGAQVEADVLSELGWINDGMAYLYYNLMRYAVDVDVYGTLAELKEHGPPYPSDDLVGVADPVGTYEDAYAKGREWIERGQAWARHLQKIEDGIAVAAPGLVRQEIFRVARAMGAEKVAIYPDLTFYPGADSYFRLDIERTGEGSWHLFDNNGYDVRINVLGPESFEVVSSTSGSFTVTKVDDDHYTVVSEQGTYSLERTGLGWIISGPGGSFEASQGPNGGTVVTPPGNEYRKSPDGTFQIFKDGLWAEVGGPVQTIDGTAVPISQGTIQIGSFSLDLVGSVPRIGFDNLWVVLSDPITIEGTIGPATITVRDDYAVVNWLSTRTADGVWRRWGGDLTRHRMTLLEQDRWAYELKREGAILQVEPNRERFGVRHAVEENDPLFLGGSGYPAWMRDPDAGTGWFDPRTGALSSATAYHQTRLCWLCGGSGDEQCPICHGVDNDGDTFSDVRKYPADATDWHDPPYQSTAVPQPLVLTETYFKFGVNVAVWKDKARTLLGFPDPDWGYFALASAKAGWMNPDTGRFTYGISDLEARKDWVDEGRENLYTPDWEARLVSSRTAIRSDDLNDLTSASDTGAGFLLRGFQETEWLESADDRNPAWQINAKMKQMTSKEGRAFDAASPEVEKVLGH